MVEYDLKISYSVSLWEWVSIQPNLINLYPYDGKRLYCEFNHATEAEQTTFKEQLVERLFEIDLGGGVFESLLNQISLIKTDLPIFNTELSITKTNIGSAYVDLFPNYGGRSFFADTTGFKKIMYQIYLNLNGSNGIQSLRVVDHADDTRVLMEVTVANGQNQDTGVTIPDNFKKFRGRLRIQVKSTTPNDDPIYDGVRLLLRR
jgi:hypothetical protein